MEVHTIKKVDKPKDNDPDYTEDNIYGKPTVIGNKVSKEAKPFVPKKQIDNAPKYDEDNIFGKAKVIGSAPEFKPNKPDSLKDTFVAFIGRDFMQLDFGQKEWSIGNLNGNLEMPENASIVNLSNICEHSNFLFTGGI